MTTWPPPPYSSQMILTTMGIKYLGAMPYSSSRIQPHGADAVIVMLTGAVRDTLLPRTAVENELRRHRTRQDERGRREMPKMAMVTTKACKGGGSRREY